MRLPRHTNVFAGRLLALVSLSLLLGSIACQAPAPAPLAPTEVPTVVPGPPLQVTVDVTRLPSAPPPGPTAAPDLLPKPTPAHSTALTTFTTTNFAGSGVCATCHAPLKDEADVEVSIPTHWRSTMMANASKDPFWQAKVQSEVIRNPGLQAVIEEKCVTCHMPMAETQARAEGKTIAALGDGFLNPENPLHAAGMDGVSCTFCHQIQEQNLGQKASFSGGYAIDTAARAPDRLIFGPYTDPVGELMQASTGFKPVYGAQMTRAELCATCHNLYTPYVDAAGNVLGEFPEQTPYSEWQHSAFGAAGTVCQDCHMPRATGGVVISALPPDLAPRQPFYQHFFVGGNAFILTMLRDHGAELGVTADPEHFDATRARVEEQLSRRTATLSLQSLERQGDTLVAQLQIAVATGHKFPTSFPSRRAWLHVTVVDAAGQVVFESGKPQGDGSIAGNAADADPAAFEPHYDVITRPDQVQIYEPIMGDSDGKVTYTLLRAGQYLKDNRLLPVGFDKVRAPADIAVYGEAARDENFMGGGDLITYRVDVEGFTGPFTFNARLLYEPLSYRFIQDLLLDGTELTERFGRYYAAADKTPMLVSAIEPTTKE
jgi:hypothetical protein